VSTFEKHLEQLLDHKANSKGYDGGKGQLWLMCKDLPHPLGEIIYKVIRYSRQGNPDDLVKIAGWAKLVWEETQRAEVAKYVERRPNGGGIPDGTGYSGDGLSDVAGRTQYVESLPGVRSGTPSMVCSSEAGQIKGENT
jgi:hypothetical protein